MTVEKQIDVSYIGQFVKINVELELSRFKTINEETDHQFSTKNRHADILSNNANSHGLCLSEFR